MEKNTENKEGMKNAVSYIPLVAFVLFFIWKSKNEPQNKHVIYGMLLFWVYLILSVIFSWLIDVLLFLLYIWVSSYFWYMAYSWEDVEVKLVDDYIDKFK